MQYGNTMPYDTSRYNEARSCVFSRLRAFLSFTVNRVTSLVPQTSWILLYSVHPMITVENRTSVRIAGPSPDAMPGCLCVVLIVCCYANSGFSAAASFSFSASASARSFPFVV